MLALVGVVLSYAMAAAGAPSAGPAAFDDICIAGAPACELPALPERDDVVYATPVEVDCPAPAGTTAVEDGQPAVGTCTIPVLDFHYRVSRLPESERPAGAFQPQRARRTTRGASCTGLPPERGTQLSIGVLQPAAIYATWELIPPASQASGLGSTVDGPSRALEPLDRPPRG